MFTQQHSVKNQQRLDILNTLCNLFYQSENGNSENYPSTKLGNLIEEQAKKDDYHSIIISGGKVTKCYDFDFIAMEDYLYSNIGKNPLNIDSEIEFRFFINVIISGDFEGFLYEYNKYKGKPLSTERDWYNWVSKYLSISNNISDVNWSYTSVNEDLFDKILNNKK